MCRFNLARAALSPRRNQRRSEWPTSPLLHRHLSAFQPKYRRYARLRYRHGNLPAARRFGFSAAIRDNSVVGGQIMTSALGFLRFTVTNFRTSLLADAVHFQLQPQVL